MDRHSHQSHLGPRHWPHQFSRYVLRNSWFPFPRRPRLPRQCRLGSSWETCCSLWIRRHLFPIWQSVLFLPFRILVLSIKFFEFNRKINVCLACSLCNGSTMASYWNCCQKLCCWIWGGGFQFFEGWFRTISSSETTLFCFLYNIAGIGVVHVTGMSSPFLDDRTPKSQNFHNFLSINKRIP